MNDSGYKKLKLNRYTYLDTINNNDFSIISTY